MDELINKQEVVDLLKERASSLCGIYGDLGGACSGAAKLIMQMPPTQPVIVPCDYVKACNVATMDKLTSAVLYLNVLEELKKHGYVLVDMREVTE